MDASFKERAGVKFLEVQMVLMMEQLLLWFIESKSHVSLLSYQPTAQCWCVSPESGQWVGWDPSPRLWGLQTWRTSWTSGHCSPWKRSRAEAERPGAAPTSRQTTPGPPHLHQLSLRSETPDPEPRWPPVGQVRNMLARFRFKKNAVFTDENVYTCTQVRVCRGGRIQYYKRATEAETMWHYYY